MLVRALVLYFNRVSVSLHLIGLDQDTYHLVLILLFPILVHFPTATTPKNRSYENSYLHLRVFLSSWATIRWCSHWADIEERHSFLRSRKWTHMTQELSQKRVTVTDRLPELIAKVPLQRFVLAAVLILSAFLNLFLLTDAGA